MVMEAYAVVDPGAVVIEAFDTPIADRAVPRPIGPYYLTVRAEENRVEVLHHLHESDWLWFLHVSRITAHSYHMK